MIQIISKTKKYVTLRMPIELAYNKDMLQKEGKVSVHPKLASSKKIDEVAPTKAEIKSISIAQKQFEKGDFISLSDLRKKYAW